MVRGKIPRCPKCFGGKLRYNSHKMIYYCPGSAEDGDYQKCNFRSKDVVREKWIHEESQ